LGRNKPFNFEARLRHSILVFLEKLTPSAAAGARTSQDDAPKKKGWWQCEASEAGFLFGRSEN
jgi:hypothetical protein